MSTLELINALIPRPSMPMAIQTETDAGLPLLRTTIGATLFERLQVRLEAVNTTLSEIRAELTKAEYDWALPEEEKIAMEQEQTGLEEQRSYLVDMLAKLA
jgi:hypothetical protein